MATRTPWQFADAENQPPDVKLLLIYDDGTEYEENPVPFHSHVLKKSEFFEAALCSRRSSNPGQHKLKVGDRQKVNHYLSCFRFMYLSEAEKRRHFTSVEEALGVLEVALELMVMDCKEACLQYLEAVHWTPKQECQITEFISSGHCKMSPDFAGIVGRLRIPELMYKTEFGRRVGTLMSSISTVAGVRDISAKLLLANFDDDAASGIAKEMASPLLRAVLCHLEVIRSESKKHRSDTEAPRKIEESCSALLWLLQHLQSLQMVERAVELFAERQDDISNDLRARLDWCVSFADSLFEILVILFQALGAGKVIFRKSVRVSFITNWCPLVEALYYSPSFVDSSARRADFHAIFVEEMIYVAETLPLVDRAEIASIWMMSLLDFSPNHDGRHPIELCNELLQFLR